MPSAKILIVEDDELVARLIRLSLVRFGYEEPVWVSTGEAALQAVQDHSLDMVLMDIGLPGTTDGIDTARTLRFQSNLPIIFLTGHADEATICRAKQAEPLGYIFKPFDPRDLQITIDTALHQFKERERHKRDELQQAERKYQALLETRLQHALELETIGRLTAGIVQEAGRLACTAGNNLRLLASACSDLKLAREHNPVGFPAEPTSPQPTTDSRDAADQNPEGLVKEEIPRAISQAIEGMNQIAAIIDALREFSPSDGADRGVVDLNRALETILTISRSSWEDIAQVITSFDPAVTPVPGFSSAIHHALLHVVLNAAQAIAELEGASKEDKGKISIATRRAGDWAEIRISDTGPGIPEVRRQQMFDLSFTTNNVRAGIGHGLSSTHSIVVDQHRGTIGIETEVGKGTTFIICFPY